ncbi:hypothetical protein QR98_0020110 [Sarcoptes scabiei]|uniref:Uncharacterized protein n=1 Tax=Sarcoptes scabiei TaxID=52283 RepID=A0A131ZXJ6_SARSC|nr:hypothetical protein QR98_0020110 [Sarcoptes scabiei]
MKVSDLKAELKKRNLPVSGAKQQLIERLKPFSDAVVINNNAIVTAEINETILKQNISNQCLNQASSNLILQQQDVCSATKLNTISSVPTTAIIWSSNNEMLSINGNQATKSFNDCNGPKSSTEEFLLLANHSDNLGTMPLQLKQTQSLNLDGTTTLAIPIGSTFIPQYHVVTSSGSNNSNSKINFNTLRIQQTDDLGAKNLVTLNNGISNIAPMQTNQLTTALNYSTSSNTIGQLNGDQAATSNLAILTAAPSRFQLTSLDNFGTALIPTNITTNLSANTKIVGIPNANNGTVFHQFLLYPNSLNSVTTSRTGQDLNLQTSKHNRSNSLPNESLHPLQRNTSLPIIINPMPMAQLSSSTESDFQLIKVQEPKTNNAINSTGSIISHEKNGALASTKILNGSNFNQKMTKFLKKIEKSKQDENMKFENKQHHHSTPKPRTNAKILTKKTQQSILDPKTVSFDLVATECTNSSLISQSINDRISIGKIDSKSDNNNNFTQPDSTTNGNCGLDFMINFDDLNDLSHFDKIAENVSMQTTTSTAQTSEPVTKESQTLAISNSNQTLNNVYCAVMKNCDKNDSINFDDNWLDELTSFADNSNFLEQNELMDQNKQQTQPSSSLVSKTNVIHNDQTSSSRFAIDINQNDQDNDNSLFETINKLFENDFINQNTNGINNSNNNLDNSSEIQLNNENSLIKIDNLNSDVTFDCLTYQNYSESNNNTVRCDSVDANNNNSTVENNQMADTTDFPYALDQRSTSRSMFDSGSSNDDNNNNRHILRSVFRPPPPYYSNHHHIDINQSDQVPSSSFRNDYFETSNNHFYKNPLQSQHHHNHHLNSSHESFGDLFFDENDFKSTSSMDFPILLDKIDFAT